MKDDDIVLFGFSLSLSLSLVGNKDLENSWAVWEG